MSRKSIILCFLVTFVVLSNAQGVRTSLYTASFSEGQPIFALIDAQRYFMNLTTFPGGNRQTWIGYQFNITVTNVGSDAIYVDMYVYRSVVNTIYAGPPISQMSYGQDEEGEFSTKLRLGTWKKNETMRALFDQQHLDFNWIKFGFTVYSDSAYSSVIQKQTLILYFHTLLSVYNNPCMHEYLEPYNGAWRWWGVIDNITIGGRLLNTTSGSGLLSEEISIFYRGRVEGAEGLWTSWISVASVQTTEDGFYSYVWTPPATRFQSSDVIYELKVVWNQSGYYAVGFGNVFLPPKTPTNSPSTALVYIALGAMGVAAVSTALFFRRRMKRDRVSLSSSQGGR